MSTPIDAVFTWVDGRDPHHQAKREYYLGFTANPEKVQTKNPSTRFNDAGELWFSVHMLRRNAPWIRTIYLVTDDQCPPWLDGATAQKLGVELVDHRTLFEGYEQYLPTFNSRTIEAMLHRIPGLSEHFLYLNDDVFITKAVQPDAFFDGDKIVLRGTRKFKLKSLEKLRARTEDKLAIGYIGRRAESRECPWLFHFFAQVHCPHPLSRKRMKTIVEDSGRIDEILPHRFRHKSQPWPIGLHTNQLIRDNAYRIQPEQDWTYIDCPLLEEASIPTILEAHAHDEKQHFLCIQSLDLADIQVQKEVKTELRRMSISNPENSV